MKTMRGADPTRSYHGHISQLGAEVLTSSKISLGKTTSCKFSVSFTVVKYHWKEEFVIYSLRSLFSSIYCPQNYLLFP
jgi:hypothetical protein